MTEEELDKKSNAIIEEYLHINDMKVCTRRTSHKHYTETTVEYIHIAMLNVTCLILSHITFPFSNLADALIQSDLK